MEDNLPHQKYSARLRQDLGCWSKVIGILFLTAFWSRTSAETVMQVIYEVPNTNGSSSPYLGTGLIEDVDGGFFGVSSRGGSHFNSGSQGDGMIFKAAKTGAFTNLFSFSATNGCFPYGGLTRGSDGNLYGMTVHGGTNFISFSVGNDGTIFRFSTNGAFRSLLSFKGTNGSMPYGRLEFGPDGYLYGGTYAGGAFGVGTLFKVSTNGTMIWSFSFDGTNGHSPALGASWKLTRGTDDCLYGTTRYGSTNLTGPYYTGNGILFKITTNGVFTPLLYFGGTNGRMPCSGLSQIGNGDLWGTTLAGGEYGFGTIFRFTTNGTLITVASFDGTAGVDPRGGVVQGSDNSFYGTTSYSYATLTNGTIYKVTTNGELTTLVYLNGTNGLHPDTDLMLASDGNLYGAMDDITLSAAPNAGNIFRLIAPPVLSATPTTTNLLLSWTSFSNGAYRVDYTPSLAAPNWNTLKSNVTASGSTAVCSDNAGNTERYYRVVLLP